MKEKERMLDSNCFWWLYCKLMSSEGTLKDCMNYIEADLREENKWYKRLWLRLQWLWCAWRYENCCDIIEIYERIGKGGKRLSQVLFTWNAVGPAVVMLMLSCCGTLHSGLLTFLESTMVKLVIALVMVSYLKDIPYEDIQVRVTILIGLLAVATANLLFNIVQVPVAVLGYIPIGIVGGFMLVCMIYRLSCRFGVSENKQDEEAEPELQMLKSLDEFFMEPARFLGKMAKTTRNPAFLWVVLVCCFVGTVTMKEYVVELELRVFWATTFAKFALLWLFMAWMLQASAQGHIVQIDLCADAFEIGSADWCFQILKAVALTNLAMSFPPESVLFVFLIFLILWPFINFLKNVKKMFGVGKKEKE